MKKQLHVYWSGRVQGVGFRFTAEAAAIEQRLWGWVRNIPDGRVEAICEGPEAKLKQFLDQIATGPMQRYIQNTEVHWQAPTGEFDGFQIRFF